MMADIFAATLTLVRLAAENSPKASPARGSTHLNSPGPIGMARCVKAGSPLARG